MNFKMKNNIKTKTIAINHQSFNSSSDIVGRENLSLDTMKKSYMHVIN